MRRRGLVFDIKGVLEVNPPERFEVRWASRLGRTDLAEVLAPVWRDGSVGACSLEVIEHRVSAALGLDAATAKAFWDECWAHHLGERNERMLGAMEDCYGFAKLGILSNSFVGAREREEPFLGVFPLCDAVIYSHEVGLEKPDPAIYALTVEQMRLDPADLLLIDEGPENIDAARSAGWDAVLYQDVDEVLERVRAFVFDT